MASQYSVRVANHSNSYWTFVVYQQVNGLGVPNAVPLAWLTQSAPPTGMAVFSWVLDYSFVWSQTGQLVPGVELVASQSFPADPTSLNEVTLTSLGGAVSFTDQHQGPKPGSLSIVSDATVPLNQIAVGIGMSGAPVYAAQAMPNTQVTFTPQPQYWLAFGEQLNPGEVLDPAQLSSQSVLLAFSSGVNSMTVTLGTNLVWTVSQG